MTLAFWKTGSPVLFDDNEDVEENNEDDNEEAKDDDQAEEALGSPYRLSMPDKMSVVRWNTNWPNMERSM